MLKIQSIQYSQTPINTEPDIPSFRIARARDRMNCQLRRTMEHDEMYLYRQFIYIYMYILPTTSLCLRLLILWLLLLSGFVVAGFFAVAVTVVILWLDPVTTK